MSFRSLVLATCGHPRHGGKQREDQFHYALRSARNCLRRNTLHAGVELPVAPRGEAPVVTFRDVAIWRETVHLAFATPGGSACGTSD